MKTIRRIIATVVASLGLIAPPASAQSISTETFFELVSLGSKEEVSKALESDPALATVRDKYGFSAVHALDYIEFAQKLALLQRYGADINAQNDKGHALLHILIDPGLVPDAVAAGGDINLRDNMQRTPIMLQMLEPDAIEYLPAYLAMGADPNARDAKGRSVLDYAAAFEDPEMITMLIQSGAKQ